MLYTILSKLYDILDKQNYGVSKKIQWLPAVGEKGWIGGAQRIWGDDEPALYNTIRINTSH